MLDKRRQDKNNLRTDCIKQLIGNEISFTQLTWSETNINMEELVMCRKTKYGILISMIVCCLFLFSSATFASVFTDTQGHWAEKEINKWANNGLAGGYSNGDFQPNGKVTRAEFVTLVNRAFGIEKQSSVGTFSDINSEAWFFNDVCTAKAVGYVSGYQDGTFKPNKTITRQEVAGILTRLLNLEQNPTGVNNFKDWKQIPQWSRASIGAVVTNNLMGGFPDNTFKPLQSITRAEAVVSLDRAMQFNPAGLSKQDEPVTKTAVQGKVTFEGTPVKAAVIRIFKADSYKVLTQTLTNSNGIYKAQTEPGIYDITVSTNEAVNYKGNIELEESTVTEIDFSLLPAAILHGKIEDEKGKGIKDAPIFYTDDPTFVAYTGESGSYKIPVLPGFNYDVHIGKSGSDDEKITLVAERVKVNSAGEKFMETFVLSSPDSGASGSGGSDPDSGDTADETPPKFTYASVTVDGEKVEAVLTANGLQGTIDLSNQPGSSKITKGTVIASEDSTLQMECSSMPEALMNIIPSLMSTTQVLTEEQPTTIEAFDMLGAGIPLSLLKTVLGQNSMTLEGTLEDSSGNTSDVSLTIRLP